MHYFIKTSNGEKGPFTVEQVAALAQQGKLRPDHVIRAGDERTAVKVADVIASQTPPRAPNPAQTGEPEAPAAPAQRKTRPQTARTTRSGKTGTKTIAKKVPDEEAEAPPKGLVGKLTWRFNQLPWWIRWPSVAGFLGAMLFLTIGLEDSRIADSGDQYRSYAKQVIAKEVTDTAEKEELFDLIDHFHEECLKESISTTRGYKSSSRRADEETYLKHLVTKLKTQVDGPDQLVLNSMAWTIAQQPGAKRLPSARGYAQRAVEMAREAKNKEWLARNLDTLAFIQSLMGEREAAARTQDEAVSYSDALPTSERNELLDRQKKYRSK